jgi:hypothetical protein
MRLMGLRGLLLPCCSVAGWAVVVVHQPPYPTSPPPQAAYFVALPDLAVSPSGTLNVTLPPDGVVTITTVGGGGRGSPRTPVPAPAPFPLPYFDDFSEYPYDGIARYLSDQVRVWIERRGPMLLCSLCLHAQPMLLAGARE